MLLRARQVPGAQLFRSTSMTLGCFFVDAMPGGFHYAISETDRGGLRILLLARPGVAAATKPAQLEGDHDNLHVDQYHQRDLE